MSNRGAALLSRKAVLCACAMLTLAYAIFSIHGFSLSRWHFLDGSPETELLLGASQGARSDDWALWLPFAFAQIEHDPSFALINENVGLGQNMALVVSAAIADPLLVFRPATWGFFVGPDFGMGWCWGLYVFGFLAAFHLLFMEISDERKVVSILAAVALLFSPFFQFWSLNPSFVASTVALGVVAAHRLVLANRRHEKWLYGLGLGWSAGAFALTLYPPYQVVMGYFGVFVVVGLVLRSRKRGRTLHWDRHHVFGALAASLIFGFAILHLFQIAHDAIAVIAGTVYPGQRVASGGSSGLWRIFSNNVFPHLFIRASQAFGGNISEAASFTLFFPLVLALLMRGPWRRSFAGDPLLRSLFAYVALLLAWNLVAWPDALARLSLFSKAPEYRTPIGFGIADMALVVAWLGLPVTQAAPLRSKLRLGAFGLAMLLPLLLLFLAASRRDPQFLGSGALLQIALLVSAQIAIGILLARRHLGALLLFAFLNVISTGWFNPVAHAGSAYLWNNPVSTKIREIDAAHGGHSSWIVFDDLVVGQLPPLLGARSLASVQFYPQTRFWRILDPEQRMTPAYDRFAHVAFRVRSAPGPLTILSPSPDVSIVDCHPDDPRLLALPFDYVIQAGAPSEALLRSQHYRRLSAAGEFHFFERIRD